MHGFGLRLGISGAQTGGHTKPLERFMTVNWYDNVNEEIVYCRLRSETTSIVTLLTPESKILRTRPPPPASTMTSSRLTSTIRPSSNIRATADFRTVARLVPA